jgi:hypothetical protein
MTIPAEDGAPQDKAEDKIINQFSHPKGEEKYIRYTIRQDAKGLYHIDCEEIQHVTGDDGNPAINVTAPMRKDIHGDMTLEDYNAWMSNVLWNQYYMAASKAERSWMMG